MADVAIKMVVRNGVRYREEHVPAATEEAKAQPVDNGAEVQHKQRTPRKTAARKVSASE
jgi:hypothetical protein